MRLLLNKAFFGKKNCFKVALNERRECYFHFGMEKNGSYEWKKVKMSDAELGEISQVLRKERNSTAFFHNFNGNKTQIWVNRKDNHFFIKVRELSKSFSEGEQEVLRILLERAILQMNSL
ncbi:hypothetical protein GF323_04925 [Candidatus Woesearchaeota archaeon]|nr:hypothetical protein [Candidatus Woesearchaeota archaeon]